jgi:hypothetical protein
LETIVLPLLLVPVLLSSSVEAAVGVVGDKGADGRADGKPVGKVGVCTCCANPTIDKKKQPRLTVVTSVARRTQVKDLSCTVLTCLSCHSIHVQLLLGRSPFSLLWFNIKFAHLDHNRSHNGFNRKNNTILLFASRKNSPHSGERASHYTYRIAIIQVWVWFSF